LDIEKETFISLKSNLYCNSNIAWHPLKKNLVAFGINNLLRILDIEKDIIVPTKTICSVTLIACHGTLMVQRL